VSRRVPRRKKPVPIKVPMGPAIRLALLAIVSVAASGYGIYRYYTRSHPPMIVPRPPPPDAGEEDIRWIDLDGGLYAVPELTDGQ
jgi:hypothetical protein